MSTDLAQLACDRYEIADTLHRYAFGLDHGDAESLASAFTEDCLFDFKSARAKLGVGFNRLTGRAAIVETLLPILGPLDTSHTVSNLQIEINGDSATLHAYVMAQHFMPREGARSGSENALLMIPFLPSPPTVRPLCCSYYLYLLARSHPNSSHEFFTPPLMHKPEKKNQRKCYLETCFCLIISAVARYDARYDFTTASSEVNRRDCCQRVPADWDIAHLRGRRIAHVDARYSVDG